MRPEDGFVRHDPTVAELTAELASLRQELARLAAENANLKASIASHADDAAPEKPAAVASPKTIEPTPPAGSRGLKRAAGRVGRVLSSPLRSVLRPLVWRVRTFFNQPTMAEVDRLRSELEGLGKRIEDILVTLAMTRGRD